MSPQNDEKISIGRASKFVGLTILSPAILAISGCSSPQTPYANNDCDNNRRTPQTEDDCNRRSGSGARGFYGGSRNYGNNNFSGGSDANSTRSGGFGGIGRFFSGGGS